MRLIRRSRSSFNDSDNHEWSGKRRVAASLVERVTESSSIRTHRLNDAWFRAKALRLVSLF
jgi:hypothetical protein